MNYGYARCSTNETKQDINRQVKELTEAGVNRDNIYLEWEHGDAACKKELNKLLDVVAPGDSIYTTEVSRLTRSTKQLCELLEIIRLQIISNFLGVLDCIFIPKTPTVINSDS